MESKTSKRLLAFAGVCCAFVVCTTRAVQGDTETPPKVTSDIEPAAPKPAVWNLDYKIDGLSANGTGLERTNAVLGLLHLTLSLDGGKLWNRPGSGFFIDLLNLHGRRLNQTIGTGQGIDNIEGQTSTTRLYQLWYQQQSFGDKLSLLAGLYDLNSEFYVTDASGVFLHPSFGIGSEMGQTGKNGPSIFPVTSVGVRIRLQPAHGWYWQTVVLDGVPGEVNHPHGTHVRFDKGDGQLQVSEAGFLSDPNADSGKRSPWKLAFGAWRYTARADDLIDLSASGSPVQRRNKGFYAVAQGRLFDRAGDRRRGVDGFVRYGVASREINRFGSAAEAGLIYIGAFEHRAEDVLGFGIAAARFGAKFREASEAAGEPSFRSETAYELTYRARVTRRLAIQPVMQHIRSAGTAGAKHVNVAGIRFELALGQE